jgi:hypothetical protein
MNAELTQARAAGINFARDFFTLSASEVGRVLDLADAFRYRKPKNANGSRGRYYFARLQRLAHKEASQ